MYITKVLKRKDASSVIVAVVLAFSFINFLSAVSARPAGQLLGLDDGTYASYSFPGSGFKGTYLYPLVSFLIQLVLVEIAIAFVVWVRPYFVRKKR